MTLNKDKWAFIANPVAGNGAIESLIPILEKQILSRRIKSKIFYTELPGHATEIAM